MIVDLILNRKDGAKYLAHRFYSEVSSYGQIGASIAAALDTGTEEDVKSALCAYINDNNYNPAIAEYVHSQTWL